MSVTVPPAPPCPMCNEQPLVTDEERRRNVCADCAHRTGLWIDPPDVRPPVPCPRCNHTQFVQVLLRDRVDNPAAGGGGMLVPLAATYHTYGVRNTSGSDVKLTVSDTLLGLVVSYVCRGCGFTELYTVGFQAIPIGPPWGTKLVDVGPQGPDAGAYR